MRTPNPADAGAFDAKASQRITKSVPRLPQEISGQPLHKNYGVRLHAITDPLEHQAQQNAMKMSHLYTLKHLKVLGDISDRQIAEIHAWVDPANGVIQRFSDQMLPSHAVDGTWECVMFYLYRSKGHLFVDDVWAGGDLNGFAAWFGNQRGRRIPVPADGEIYHPVQTSPDVQKRHNNSKLHELYAHPAAGALVSGDTLIMEAWVNIVYGFITMITVPNAYVGDSSETRVGMMVECDRHGLLVYFTDLSGLGEMLPIHKRYFENPIFSTIPPDGWVARHRIAAGAGGARDGSNVAGGLVFTDSDVRGEIHADTAPEFQGRMVVAAGVHGDIGRFQEVPTSVLGMPQGAVAVGMPSQAAHRMPTVPAIPPIKR